MHCAPLDDIGLPDRDNVRLVLGLLKSPKGGKATAWIMNLEGRVEPRVYAPSKAHAGKLLKTYEQVLVLPTKAKKYLKELSKEEAQHVADEYKYKSVLTQECTASENPTFLEAVMLNGAWFDRAFFPTQKDFDAAVAAKSTKQQKEILAELKERLIAENEEAEEQFAAFEEAMRAKKRREEGKEVGLLDTATDDEPEEEPETEPEEEPEPELVLPAPKGRKKKMMALPDTTPDDEPEKPKGRKPRMTEAEKLRLGAGPAAGEGKRRQGAPQSKEKKTTRKEEKPKGRAKEQRQGERHSPRRGRQYP